MLLKTLGHYPVYKIVDKNGMNLLHHAVLKGVEGKVQLLLDFAKNYQRLNAKEINQWINFKTYEEQWTPIHYASFTSNLDAIYTLIQNGADFNALNANGLNQLHVASQGDSAAPLYLFKMLGIKLDSVDYRGSTPVHWACYSQSEIALCYLLAWKPNLDLQDKEGYTALHLAVKNVEELGSCRSVRALIYKGANKSIKDKKGNLPIDYVDDIK